MCWCLASFGQAGDNRSLRARHGDGVRYRMGGHTNMACIGEAAMKVILNDLLLFTCLAAFVTGIVIAAATLLV